MPGGNPRFQTRGQPPFPDQAGEARPAPVEAVERSVAVCQGGRGSVGRAKGRSAMRTKLTSRKPTGRVLRGVTLFSSCRGKELDKIACHKMLFELGARLRDTDERLRRIASERPEGMAVTWLLLAVTPVGGRWRRLLPRISELAISPSFDRISRLQRRPGCFTPFFTTVPSEDIDCPAGHSRTKGG